MLPPERSRRFTRSGSDVTNMKKKQAYHVIGTDDLKDIVRDELYGIFEDKEMVKKVSKRIVKRVFLAPKP
jgi:hypothetical protein